MSTLGVLLLCSNIYRVERFTKIISNLTFIKLNVVSEALGT